MKRRNAVEVCWLAKFVGKVRQCCVMTRVDKESKLEINSLPAFNQCSWRRSGVMRSSRDDREYQPSSEVHHRLKLLEQIQRTGEVGVSEIQPRQNKRRHNSPVGVEVE